MSSTQNSSDTAFHYLEETIMSMIQTVDNNNMVLFTDRVFENMIREMVVKDAAETKVSIVDIRDAVGSGQNYCSEVKRVTLRICRPFCKPEKRSVIVKTMPQSEEMQKFMENSSTFTKEILVYNEIIPNLHRLLQESRPFETVKPLAPRSYNLSFPNTLILDDLEPLGYKMVKRQDGLDYPHCLLAIKALARYHASSIALYKRDQSSMDMFIENLLEQEGKEFLVSYLMGRMSKVADVVESWRGYKRFGKKIRDVAPTIIDTIVRLANDREGSIVALTHGDFWINNMLFKYSDNGKVEDIAVIDFQMCRFVSVALDLYYFFCTSPNQEVRAHLLDRLLADYHSELCKILRDLKCDSEIITLDQLKKEMDDKYPYYVFTACVVLCIVFVDPKDAPVFGAEDKSSSGTNNSLYSNSRYKKTLKKLLLEFEKKEFF